KCPVAAAMAHMRQGRVLRRWMPHPGPWRVVCARMWARSARSVVVSRPSIHLSMQAIVVPRWVAWLRMWVMTARASSSVGEWSARRSRTTRMARVSGVSALLVHFVHFRWSTMVHVVHLCWSEGVFLWPLVLFFSSSSLRRGRGGAAASARAGRRGRPSYCSTFVLFHPGFRGYVPRDSGVRTPLF